MRLDFGRGVDAIGIEGEQLEGLGLTPQRERRGGAGFERPRQVLESRK